MNCLRRKDWRRQMITKNDYRYFNKARQVAMISDYCKIHIGCVAVYKGKIISVGCNCNKTHPTQKFYNRYRIPSDSMLPKLHAEINCINSIKHMNINFSKVKIYIYRIRKNRLFGLSRPCPSCMEAIKDLGIRDIYYTNNNRYVHERIEKNDMRGVA